MRKLGKSRAGFSLAETLIAILILLMVSAIVGGAIPVASNVFTKTVDAANAQLLLSTTVTVLRDQLSIASEVASNGSDKIKYKSGDTGDRCLIVMQADGTLELYFGSYECKDSYNPNDYTKGHYSLISKKAATLGMKVSFTSIVSSTDKKVITISGLKVSKGSVSLTDKDGRALKIRVVS
jgi:type II secretory pathway pseudopilin PulG